MKKLLLILSLLVCVNTFAISPAQYFIYMAWLSAPAYIGVEYFRYHEDCLQDGVYVSFGLDPKMILTEGADMRFKTFYHIGRLEPVAMVEVFPAMDVEMYGLGLNYQIIDRKMGLHAGLESNYVRNWNGRQMDGISYGLNIGLRLMINERWSVEWETNVKTRPCLLGHHTSRYSNYIHLNYKL